MSWPTCKSCGAPVAWMRTTKGRRMPVDPEAVPGRGNIVVDRGVARVLGREEAAAARKAGARLLTSHYATCPDAAAHRKPKASPAR